MVFFNYATMQMAAKIVYYGPGLCGKTTNLHHIYTKTSPQSRGEMVSLETETDRTLFFDLLPIDVGVIGGFKTRLQLYTVPGQVFYNTTRKLVLKGVDGIVFVADSQTAMLDANAESFANLRENLGEIGLSVDELPLVVQLNKRDLPNVATPDTILNRLEPGRDFDFVEAVAAGGTGVFETLKLISKLTLRTLRRRMTGEDANPSRRLTGGTVRTRDPQAAAPPAGVAAEKPVALEPPDIEPPPEVATAVVTPPEAEPAPVVEEAASADVFGEETLAAAPSLRLNTIPEGAPRPEVAATTPVPEIEVSLDAAQTVAEPDEETAPFLDVPTEAPHEEAPPPVTATEGAPEPHQAGEPDIDFKQTARAGKKPDVKHVKVRSSVDIMAELEALRKRATQSTSKPRKEAAREGPEASARRDVHRTITMEASPDARTRASSVRITVSFEDGEGVLQREEQSIELAELSDVRSLSVDLKIALE